MSRDPMSVLDDHAVEQLLAGGAVPAGADLAPVIDLMRSLADSPAPPPSAALAELLDGGFQPAVVPLRRPTTLRRTWAARVAGVVAAVVASILAAGVAQALPPALQDGVAGLVSALTPWELPRPDHDQPERAVDPTPVEDAPSGTPQTSMPPSPSTARAVPAAAPPRDDPGQAAEDRGPATPEEDAKEPAHEEAPEQPGSGARETADDADDAADPANATTEQPDSEDAGA